jgi:8-oxo-dGTP diphosphatase
MISYRYREVSSSNLDGLIMKRVSKVILYKGNKILLQLRDNQPNTPHPNIWSLFGGKIEGNETPEECLAREIKEELNGTLKNIIFIKKRIRPGNDGEVEDNIFSAELQEAISELELTEGQAMKYFSKEQLNEIDIVPHYKKFIEDFLKQH